MRTEIQNMRMELSGINMMDEFARYARLERKINKMTDQLKTLGKHNLMKFLWLFIGACAARLQMRWQDNDWFLTSTTLKEAHKTAKMCHKLCNIDILKTRSKGQQVLRCLQPAAHLMKLKLAWNSPKWLWWASLFDRPCPLYSRVKTEEPKVSSLHKSQVWKMAGGFQITASVFMKEDKWPGCRLSLSFMFSVATVIGVNHGYNLLKG